MTTCIAPTTRDNNRNRHANNNQQYNNSIVVTPRYHVWHNKQTLHTVHTHCTDQSWCGQQIWRTILSPCRSLLCVQWNKWQQAKEWAHAGAVRSRTHNARSRNYLCYWLCMSQESCVGWVHGEFVVLVVMSPTCVFFCAVLRCVQCVMMMCWWLVVLYGTY